MLSELMSSTEKGESRVTTREPPAEPPVDGAEGKSFNSSL